MPQQSKGARLWLDKKRRQWVIRDGKSFDRTGCAEGDREGAERALAAYLAGKYQPPGEGRAIYCADVLIAYANTSATEHRSSATVYAVDALTAFWGARPITDIRKSTCKEYVEHRTKMPIATATKSAKPRLVKETTAARELVVLRAALNAWHSERPFAALPIVTVPATPPGRDRWLTRDEAARLLRGARGVEHPEARRALIRFILIALYTGSRSGAIRGLAWRPNTVGGWVDVKRGVIHRRASGEIETTKRKPSIAVPDRLAGFLRRWAAADEAAGRTFVVSYRGEPVDAQRRSWMRAREIAGLDEAVTPHILRHTAATWMMHSRLDPDDAADYLGMSIEVYQKVYRHAHPDYQREAASKIGRKG